jgi:hypothetical protein
MRKNRIYARLAAIPHPFVDGFSFLSFHHATPQMTAKTGNITSRSRTRSRMLSRRKV